VSPVRYELGFYIPEDDILHSYRRENLKYYIVNDIFADFSDIIYIAHNCDPLCESLVFVSFYVFCNNLMVLYVI
jgi:hypothetical protein